MTRHLREKSVRGAFFGPKHSSLLGENVLYYLVPGRLIHVNILYGNRVAAAVMGKGPYNFALYLNDMRVDRKKGLQYELLARVECLLREEPEPASADVHFFDLGHVRAVLLGYVVQEDVTLLVYVEQQLVELGVGLYGRDDPDFTWEKTNPASALKKRADQLIVNRD